MIGTREKAGGARRPLVSSAALGTAVALALGGMVATPAFAAPGGTATGVGSNHETLRPTLTVSPGESVNPDGDTTLTLSGTGYATTNAWGQNFGGAYLLFGVVNPKNGADPGSWAPSKQGISGTNYDYAAGAGVYQSLIGYPGNTTEPGLGFMDQNGNWQTTLTIPGAVFESQAGNQIDCLEQQCGVITIGAHGSQQAGVEVFTPITFAEQNWEAVAPSFTAQPSDQSLAVGGTATFSVAVAGDPAPGIQWQSRAGETGEFADIADATGASLVVEGVRLADTGTQYRAVVTNEAGTVTSSVATLTVTEAAPEPSGSVTGTPLSGTGSYIVVAPGENIRVDGATTVTLEGFGFDPGPAVTPGTGSGGIYVGLGTMKTPGDPEKWRRSKGGSSGPVGMGDYTYGSPVFVANQGTGDGDVADGEMDANGNWTATVTIPQAQVPSFFGDTINCLAVQCGFFSFGAHGVVKAQNEAFTPVYFAGQEVPAEPAVATTTTVGAQATAEYPTDFAGEDVTVSATVAPADAAGTVEFFAGETSLGSAAVENGAASVTTRAFTGGAHQVTAVFTPADAARHEASTSAAKTFRIVDLAPAVATIEVGTAARAISDAELTWSVANYVSFGSGPAKSVLAGDVELNADKDFVFSGGTGIEDAAGNRVVSFDGEVRLTSGSLPVWNFRAPQVYANAAGDGYITAVVDGTYAGSILGGEDSSYGPVRVVVSTFTGAQSASEDGVTSFTVSPVFEGQVAAGTWGGSYTGATFTNQFLRFVNSGVRSFFLQSGSSSDATKAGRAIGLAYAAEEIPAASLDVTPVTGLDRAGADIAVSAASFDTSAKPSYPGAPDAPAGVYVSLGWISNDGWKPSENAASATRVAVTTMWAQQTQATGDGYVQWSTNGLGRASFDFVFEDVSYAQVLAKKPAQGDYRLAVYAIGASGVKQAANEIAVDVAFAPAATTVTSVAGQVSADLATDFAGEDVTVSATVAPADAAGTVEFFAGETKLGSAAVENGAASVTTRAFTGGAHEVTAVFTPTDAVLYEASTSAAKTFRIVDRARAIADIAVGTPVERITGATLDWSVANYYSSFGYEFGKEAIGDTVSVPETVAGDKEANSNRRFAFTAGTGTRDAAGNAVIEFTGTARLTSGTSSRWDFTDPRLHVNAQGDGYVTAEFSGYFRSEGLADITYAPERVTVATFTGAQSQTADGATAFTVTPIWEGQVAAGTWAGDYTGSFPAEFTSLLYSGIRSFFHQTGTTGANLTKPVQPISVAYTAGTAPVFTAQPQAAQVDEHGEASFAAAVSGAPTPSLQWQRRASADAEWADIAGETGAQLVISGVATSDSGAQFRAVATNAFGAVASDAARLTVLPAKPTVEPTAPVLTDDNSGDFEVISIDGRTVVVSVGAEHAGTWIGVTLHSDPRFLGWFLADVSGRVSVTVPADVSGAHRLSYVTAAGELLGWVPVSFAAGGGDTNSGGTTGGSGTDTAGARLSTTGGSAAPLALAGSAVLLLLAAGAATLVVARRRSAAKPE